MSPTSNAVSIFILTIVVIMITIVNVQQGDTITKLEDRIKLLEIEEDAS